MTLAPPQLDHVVVDARNMMDQTAEIYRSLGFHLTERGRHTLGSINHLAMFDDNYLELLGFENNSAPLRQDIAVYPAGLNGLVFKADDPDFIYRELQHHGIPVEAPVEFSRPVTLPDQATNAKFSVVRLRSDAFVFGRVYFCQHRTPDLIWRSEWQAHPNGAVNIDRVIIAVHDRNAYTDMFSRMFGADNVNMVGHSMELKAGNVRIELASPKQLKERFGEAMPKASGRGDYMVALNVRTSSLSKTAEALRSGGINCLRIESQRILVPARAAGNTTIQFVL